MPKLISACAKVTVALVLVAATGSASQALAPASAKTSHAGTPDSPAKANDQGRADDPKLSNPRKPDNQGRAGNPGKHVNPGLPGIPGKHDKPGKGGQTGGSGTTRPPRHAGKGRHTVRPARPGQSIKDGRVGDSDPGGHRVYRPSTLSRGPVVAPPTIGWKFGRTASARIFRALIVGETGLATGAICAALLEVPGADLACGAIAGVVLDQSSLPSVLRKAIVGRKCLEVGVRGSICGKFPPHPCVVPYARIERC